MDAARNLRPRLLVDYAITKNAKSASKRRAERGRSSTARTPVAATDSTQPSRASNNLNRPAEPRATNAPLVTPKGSRVVHVPGVRQIPFENSTLQANPMTTANMLDDACAHLIKSLEEPCNPFKSLTSSIMSQQVSGAAAASIKRKFIDLFEPQARSLGQDWFPTPKEVAACSIPFLRQAGLSERKAEYIQGLAQKFASGELSAATLVNASDDELMERLTAVRGLGRWSVEMFACFSLKRMDILSTGDLGVQRGMAVFFEKECKKTKGRYMLERDMQLHGERFAPYRSLFMWYMWRVEGVDVSVLEQT